jgi:outer membrane lipase/esterase
MVMKTFFVVKAFALIAVAAALAACGAGSVKDPYIPAAYTTGPAAATQATASVIVFGDALSDVTTNARYTVNGDPGLDNWALQVASSYGVAALGVKSYAAGNALVADIAAQVSSAGTQYSRDPLVLFSGGYRDLINLAQSASPTVASATVLGSAYGDAIRAAIGNGAKHVLALNVYDFSTSYNAQGGIASAATMRSLIRAFNDALKINLGNPSKTYVGDNLRLIDAEYYMNLVMGTPASYAYTDATTSVCSVTDTGSGIGLGTGKINASLCTTANVGSTLTTTYNNYVFADGVYLTPAANRGLGSYAYSLATLRW